MSSSRIQSSTNEINNLINLRNQINDLYQLNEPEHILLCTNCDVIRYKLLELANNSQMCGFKKSAIYKRESLYANIRNTTKDIDKLNLSIQTLKEILYVNRNEPDGQFRTSIVEKIEILGKQITDIKVNMIKYYDQVEVLNELLLPDEDELRISLGISNNDNDDNDDEDDDYNDEDDDYNDDETNVTEYSDYDEEHVEVESQQPTIVNEI